MQEIKKWFQGEQMHNDSRFIWAEEKNGIALCLWLACDKYEEIKVLDNIIKSLFPERVCDCAFAPSRVIHFNNHFDTTRDQIDKIIHEYKMEVGSDA